MRMLPKVTLKDFESYRTSKTNWAYIPIEYLELFKRLIPNIGEYKISYLGYDPKGRSSYLKLYAIEFSVCYRTSEMINRLEKSQVYQKKNVIKNLMKLVSVA